MELLEKIGTVCLTNQWLYAFLVLLSAPVAGALLTGIDRKLTARMQGRIGPPLLQPFYDLAKLSAKVRWRSTVRS